MTKIVRKTQKIFAGNASTDELAVFGSMTSGNPIYTDNIEDLQSADYEQGWSAAIAANEAPFLEEMNGVQYGLSKQIAYGFQEGIAEYDENTTYYKGSIVKVISDTGIPQLYYSLTDDNINNAVTDMNNWAELKLGGSSGGGFTPSLFQTFIAVTRLNHPSLGNSADYSWLNSGYVSAYNALVERYNAGEDKTETVGDFTISFKWNAQHAMKIITPEQIETAESIFNTTGEQDYFILDTENTKFKLPRFRTIPQFTNDVNKVGDYNEPALPNSSGSFGTRGYGTSATANIISPSGMVSSTTKSDTSTTMASTANAPGISVVNINLADGNPIYKDGATVQPPTTNFFLYFYLGDSTIEETSITGEVLEELNSKLDNDAGNLTNAGKSLISGLAMPSYNYEDLTLGASGTSYTAPADGYFYASLTSTGAQYGNLALWDENMTRYILASQSESTSSGKDLRVYIPCPKDGTVSFNYNATVNTFRFVYLQGSESEVE